MKNIIEIKGLNKSFGDVKAVKDLSLRVKEGELFAFLGVNGAGKSTTINIMCAQLKKDSGTVIIDGNDLDKNADAVKREIGVVFQNSVLDSPLSVKDNLESRAALYGITGDAFKERLAELADVLEFGDLLKRPVGKLSGGQRRRIDIARALIHCPDILILDDSSSALDYLTDKNMRKSISALDYNPTVFIVSQRASSVMHADKIIVLDDGAMVGIGKHAELLESCEVYREIYDTQFRGEED